MSDSMCIWLSAVTGFIGGFIVACIIVFSAPIAFVHKGDMSVSYGDRSYKLVTIP